MSPSQTSSDPRLTLQLSPQHLLYFKILFSIELSPPDILARYFIYLFIVFLPFEWDLLLVLKQYLVHSRCLVNTF